MLFSQFYEQIVAELLKYYDYDSIPYKRFLNPLWQRRVVLQSPKVLCGLYGRMGRLSEKQSEAFKRFQNRLLTAEERESEFHAILMHDYPIEALSAHMERKFPDLQIERAIEMWKLRTARLGRFNLLQILGLIVTAGSLILNLVPEATVQRLGWEYAAFQHSVFLLTMISAGYLALVMLPNFVVFRRARAKHRWIGEVLKYMKARNDFANTPNPEGD